MNDLIHIVGHLIGTFYFGSAVMRAAGCIVNDMWDKDIDNKVIHFIIKKEKLTISQPFLSRTKYYSYYQCSIKGSQNTIEATRIRCFDNETSLHFSLFTFMRWITHSYLDKFFRHRSQLRDCAYCCTLSPLQEIHILSLSHSG